MYILHKLICLYIDYIYMYVYISQLICHSYFMPHFIHVSILVKKIVFLTKFCVKYVGIINKSFIFMSF